MNNLIKKKKKTPSHCSYVKYIIIYTCIPHKYKCNIMSYRFFEFEILNTWFWRARLDMFTHYGCFFVEGGDKGQKRRSCQFSFWPHIRFILPFTLTVFVSMSMAFACVCMYVYKCVISFVFICVCAQV